MIFDQGETSVVKRWIRELVFSHDDRTARSEYDDLNLVFLVPLCVAGLTSLIDGWKAIVDFNERAAFGWNYDHIPVTEISEQCFPVLFGLRDLREGSRGDVEKFIELYL